MVYKERPPVLTTTTTTSIPPSAVSVEDYVRRLIDKHPDQVQLYADGKSCVGFFFGRATRRFADVDPKVVHLAIVNELERRVRPS